MEREIRGHIEAELEGASAPVTAERLRSVLDRLGNPGDWVPTDELPAWRRVLLQLSSGREESTGSANRRQEPAPTPGNCGHQGAVM